MPTSSNATPTLIAKARSKYLCFTVLMALSAKELWIGSPGIDGSEVKPISLIAFMLSGARSLGYRNYRSVSPAEVSKSIHFV